MRIVSLFTILVVIGVTSLSAQKKQKPRPERCTAVGTWEAAGGGKGSFRWDMIRTWNDGMIDNANGYTLKNAGNNKDEYGTFHISGTCSEMICNFTQSYNSGQLKGREYAYLTGYRTLTPFKSSKGDYYRSDVEDNNKGKFQITSMSCR